jgi:hypothetical protein
MNDTKITIRLPKELRAKVAKYCYTNRIGISELVRGLLVAQLATKDNRLLKTK